MPMETIALPRNMMNAAQFYADREHLSLVDLFAKLLRSQYGYGVAVEVVEPPTRRRMKISPRVHALRGIAKVDSSRSYRDIVAAGIVEKYESLG